MHLYIMLNINAFENNKNLKAFQDINLNVFENKFNFVFENNLI